jgi:hypothetical protein
MTIQQFLNEVVANGHISEPTGRGVPGVWKNFPLACRNFTPEPKAKKGNDDL